MNATTKLSIITINLNNYNGLKRTINSIISQTFTDYEWIVIDGGSTDGSRELIKQYTDHLAFWCSEPDKGIYNAMNKGIRHIKGEWVQFLNSGDCLYDKETLEKVFNTDYDADIIYGDLQIINSDKITVQPDKLSLYHIINRPFCQQTIFYKSNIFDNHFFSENYLIVSDIALTIELILQGYKFIHISLCVITYESNGISDTLMQKHLAERSEMFEKYIPTHIQYDLDTIKNYENTISHIQKHRWTNHLLNSFTRRLNRAYRIIDCIESIRSSIKRHKKQCFLF